MSGVSESEGGREGGSERVREGEREGGSERMREGEREGGSEVGRKGKWKEEVGTKRRREKTGGRRGEGGKYI